MMLRGYKAVEPPANLLPCLSPVASAYLPILTKASYGTSTTLAGKAFLTSSVIPKPSLIAAAAGLAALVASYKLS